MKHQTIIFFLFFFSLSCQPPENREDKIEWIKFSSDSSIFETKTIAIDSTITWKTTYENSIVNEYINGKLQTVLYNKPLKTMGAYMLSNDLLIFTVDQKVFFLSNDTIVTYQTSGCPFVLLDGELVDSILYQNVYVFKPVFCDSMKVSVFYNLNGENYYEIKDEGFDNEFITLETKYDSNKIYEVELQAWFHHSDSNHVFSERINPKLFLRQPSSK